MASQPRTPQLENSRNMPWKTILEGKYTHNICELLIAEASQITTMQCVLWSSILSICNPGGSQGSSSLIYIVTEITQNNGNINLIHGIKYIC